MELGLSKDEVIQEWNRAWKAAIDTYWPQEGERPEDVGETPPAGILGALALAFSLYAGNVVRENNRRLKEQLEKAGIRFE